MEFMIAYYPAFKLALILIAFSVSIFLYKVRFHRANYVFVITVLIFMYLSPIKIDGTESKKAHTAEINVIKKQMKEISNIKKVVIKTKTFEEIMSERENFNKIENNKIKEIINE